jgi:hypothetical protein
MDPISSSFNTVHAFTTHFLKKTTRVIKRAESSLKLKWKWELKGAHILFRHTIPYYAYRSGLNVHIFLIQAHISKANRSTAENIFRVFS